MFIGLAAALLLARDLPLLSRVVDTGSGTWKAVGSGALVICALGAIDDRWGLDALTKLVGQALAGAVMALQGVQLYYFPGPAMARSCLTRSPARCSRLWLCWSR